MDHKNRFAAETVRKLQQSLEQVAPYQATELSKQQAIRELSPQIVTLRSKGYSWTAVAAMLSEHGVPVSVAALRTYLRRAREEGVSGPARSPAKRPREVLAVTRPPPSPSTTEPSRSHSGEAPAAGKRQPAGASPASAVAAQQAAAPTSRREQESRRPTSVEASDTPDDTRW
jgi:hypothetical protein